MTSNRRSFLAQLAALVAAPKVLDALPDAAEPAPPVFIEPTPVLSPFVPHDRAIYDSFVHGEFARRSAHVYVDDVEVLDVISVESVERYGWPGVEHRVRCYASPANQKIITRINALCMRGDPRFAEVRASATVDGLDEFEFVARVSKLPPAFVRIEYSSDNWINVQTTYDEDGRGGYRKLSQKTTQRIT